MFSLIIALIAIALVAVLAGASVYYGSSAFSGNSSKADYAEIVNQAQQISSALVAFKVEGNSFDSTTCNNSTQTGCLSQIISAGYLSAVPARTEGTASGTSGWNVDSSGSLYTTTTDIKACILANQDSGYDSAACALAAGVSCDTNSDGVPNAAYATQAENAGAICVEQ